MRRRRWTTSLAAACLVPAACGAPPSSGSAPAPPPTPSVPYLTDASFRRAELVASLVAPGNGYSQLRLTHYATGDGGDWERLPEWNPPVDAIAASELDAAGGARTTPLSSSAAPLALPDDITSEDDPALVALGEVAFHRYPVQLAPYLRVALTSRASAARYGVWVDEAGGVGGLVRARMADGSGELAVTCATCHESSLVPGLPNAQLDIGAAQLANAAGPLDPAVAQAIGAWGPGRLDVSTSTGTEPVRIPDLRPVRWLSYLQADATVAMRDLSTLAIRTETLVITSNDEVVRPPRVVALALAAYVRSLAAALPSLDDAAAASPAGASIFASRCASCHQPPALTGPPVPLAVVGTDPALGESSERGTGHYRVPSLHGVATRGPLLHDGSLPSLEAMFDPARVTPSFTGRLHGTGAVEGHPFGLDLDVGDRQALLAYLGSL
jgi:cytochrome c553